MNLAQSKLHQNVGLTGVVMLGAGSAIGVSIFSVLQPAAQVAGTGLLVAMVIAALPMLLFAMAYAYLASCAPVSGASYEWPHRFVSPWLGFAIAWLRILSNVGALAVLSRVLVNYLGMAFVLPEKLVMGLAITAVFVLNYSGVAFAAKAQTALMILLIAVLGLVVAAGVPHASLATMGSPFAQGWHGIIICVPLMITLFLGIESAVEIGEEVRNPHRMIPLGIALAVTLTVVIYAAVASTALALVGPAALAASQAPLLTAAQVALSDWVKPVIIGAAVISVIKSMNAVAITFSRSIFAMARNGTLPAAVARVHPVRGTPATAIIVCYLAAMTGLLMPSSLVFLLLAVNVPTMMKYAACSLAAVRVSERHPELHAQALGFSRRTVRFVGYGGIIAALVITVAGLEADARPYVLVLGWLAIGMAGYAYARWHRRAKAPVSA